MSLLGSPPPEYLDRVTSALRHAADAGRGDNARGRNLAALYVLDQALARGWLSYAPSRDPAKWFAMLLDLVGAHAGLPPEERVELTLAEGRRMLRQMELGEIAVVTERAGVEAFARRYELTPVTVEHLVAPMGVYAFLWKLDFDPTETLRAPAERHTQGRVVRKKIGRVLDDAWSDALRAHEASREALEFGDVLAAIPPSFERTYRLIDDTLHRVDESLADAPFAVYWALATDASKGGRVWDPPARYVEGGAFGRTDFEVAVGRELLGAPSRKRRYGHSVALAELGLSATFPKTVGILDGWLERFPNSELSLATGDVDDDRTMGWREHADARATEIAARRDAIHDRIGRLVRSGEGT